MIGQIRNMGISFALLSLILGCGIFDTRDPETPDGGQPTIDLPFATEPDTLISNLKLALEALVPTSYAGQFNEGFSFVPSPLDEADFPSTWGKIEEEDVHIEILSDVDEVSLTWGEPEDLVIEGDGQWFDDLPYVLVIKSGQNEAIFSGLVDLYLVELPNSTFEVIRWEDLSDGSGAPTWGRLRIDRSAF